MQLSSDAIQSKFYVIDYRKISFSLKIMYNHFRTDHAFINIRLFATRIILGSVKILLHTSINVYTYTGSQYNVSFFPNITVILNNNNTFGNKTLQT